MTTINADTSAIFFISTGRCGTQFFADKLNQHYSDIARVEHEPFQTSYKPRHYFSTFKRGNEATLSDALEEHISSIDTTLQSKNYIETGWPVYGLLPYLIHKFPGRVKIVHLFRHPIKVAASLSTLRVYTKNEWTDAVAISPSDYGVAQPHLAGKNWDELNYFCKCLFWWTEINRLALDLHQHFNDLPWHWLRFEDVFEVNNSNALRQLVNFIGLPQRPAFTNSVPEKVDRFSRKKKDRIKIQQVRQFNETIRVMQELGYSLNDVSNNEINNRYSESYLSRLVRKARRRLNPG